MVSRRRLVAGVASAAAAVAGCLSLPEGSAPDETDTSTQTTTATTDATPTREPSTTQTAGGATSDRSTDDTKYDRAVVENRTSAEHRVSVAVLQDGETLHEGTYRAPAKTGLRIQKQFDWGTHTVRASVDGGEAKTYEWEHGSCASTPHPDGNENVGVVVESDGGWSFVTNGCDYLKLGEVYVESYEPASDHRVASTTTK